jgi:hypothetical protein
MARLLSLMQRGVASPGYVGGGVVSLLQNPAEKIYSGAVHSEDIQLVRVQSRLTGFSSIMQSKSRSHISYCLRWIQ